MTSPADVVTVSTAAQLDLRHELKTPLAAIVGLAALLADSRLTSDQLKMVNAIRNAGEHLSGLIDAELMPMPPVPVARFDLVPLVRSIVDLYGPEATQRQLRLQIIADPTTPVSVQGSATYVRQLLVNLISNALRFTVVGDVAVRLGRADDRVVIDVTDTGGGFDPGSVRPRPDGTGRGLSICRQLAAELGTALHIDSILGVGTTAGFTLAIG